MYECAIGNDGQLIASACNVGLPKRYRVISFRNLALWVRAPRDSRFFRVAIKWPVVNTLGLKEKYRIVRFDRTDEQSFGVVRVGRHDDFDAADVREDTFR